MRSEIQIVAELLNDTIAKGEQLSNKAKPSMRKGHELRKSLNGLTFDPWKPKTVTPTDSQFYNPYRIMPDGSYMPHSKEHWDSMGQRVHGEFKTPRGDYANTQRFYDQYGIADEGQRRGFRGLTHMMRDIGKSFQVLEGDIIIKAEQGTKHKYRDGRNYLKTETGWRPVGASMGDRIRLRDPGAEKELDKHYRATSTLKDHISKRQTHGKIRKEMEEGFTKKFEKMLDGPMPDEYKALFASDDTKEKKKDAK